MLNGPCGGAGRGQPAITAAGVTLSITIVALTLASQQFGPRLLPVPGPLDNLPHDQLCPGNDALQKLQQQFR